MDLVVNTFFKVFLNFFQKGSGSGHKTEGGGGDNFWLLMQACLTLPKAIPAPSLLTASLNLALRCNAALCTNEAVGADDVFPTRLTSLSKQRKNIICPYGAFTPRCNTHINAISLWGLVMFSVAFDNPVYGEGKYYQLSRAPLHHDVKHTTTQ